MRRELGWVVTRDKKKNWPIADRRAPCNNPRNSCGMHLAGGGGGSAYQRGCSSEIVNKTPKGDRSGCVPRFFWSLKEAMLKHRSMRKLVLYEWSKWNELKIYNIKYIFLYFYIFSRATLTRPSRLNDDGVLPRTPEMRPKSEIYTPKRDVPPQGTWSQFPSVPDLVNSFL